VIAAVTVALSVNRKSAPEVVAVIVVAAATRLFRTRVAVYESGA